MKKTFALLALLATVGVSACTSNSPTNLPPGKYESSSKSEDANGTTRKTDKTTNVTVDDYGNKKATVEKKTTTDPKGWFNRSTTESKTTVRD